jgi:nucleoside-diphosphate-sugar epimerase
MNNAQSDIKEIMKQYYQNKKVLVTGGCGFIGSHLVETLVNYGALVTILDDLSTGSLENIATYRDKVTFIQGSVTDKEICRQAIADNTHVFHLAAFISVPQSLEDPTTCHAINIDGTFNMLEASKNAHVQRFVFSSSSAVYGTPEGRCSELAPCRPESPYGFSKLIGEQLCLQFAHCYGLETVMLRYFNVFGDRQNPNGQYAAVVAKFTDLMNQNRPITIFGDGQQTRDFVPVDQVVMTNLLVGMAPKDAIKERIFNVATGKSITLLELFEELKKRFPSYSLAPQFLPARSGDIRESYADCNRLVGLLNQSSFFCYT